MNKLIEKKYINNYNYSFFLKNFNLEKKFTNKNKILFNNLILLKNQEKFLIESDSIKTISLPIITLKENNKFNYIYTINNILNKKYLLNEKYNLDIIKYYNKFLYKNLLNNNQKIKCRILGENKKKAIILLFSGKKLKIESSNFYRLGKDFYKKRDKYINKNNNKYISKKKLSYIFYQKYNNVNSFKYKLLNFKIINEKNKIILSRKEYVKDLEKFLKLKFRKKKKKKKNSTICSIFFF